MIAITTRQRRRFITTILLVVLLIFTAERIYNSQAKFQVTAKEPEYYGTVNAGITKSEKLKDFDYLYKILEDNYPFFEVNKRLHGIDWLANKRQYKRLIRNTKSDQEYLVAMDRILGDLNDDHLNIFTGEGFRWLYNSYYQSYAQSNNLEGLRKYNTLTNPYVMFRYQFNGNVEGLNFNEGPALETDILIQDELAYMKVHRMDVNPSTDHNQLHGFLKTVEDYEKLIIDIRGNLGGFDQYWENIVQLLIDEPLNVEYYSFFKRGHRDSLDPYRVTDSTTVDELDKDILDKFPKEVGTDFNFYKKYFIHINPWYDSLDPTDKVNFKGKIYLLVDENVFSSAEKFASFAKDSGFATLVGEPTGGNRVFESIPVFHLPISKFAIRYSREMAINVDGTINMETGTIPHIEVNATPNEDFNKDLCIQAVIRD